MLNRRQAIIWSSDGPGDQCISRPWGQFSIKMSSYQYRNSHCGDNTTSRRCYLHNRILYTGKTKSLYWVKGVDDLCMIEMVIKWYYPNSGTSYIGTTASEITSCPASMGTSALEISTVGEYIASPQYGKSHCRDKMVTKAFYPRNGLSSNGKIAFRYRNIY